MRSFFILAMFLALVVGCRDASVPPRPSGATSAAEWERRVLKAKGPVLVDFGATWCGPCRAMEPALARLSSEFQVVKIDVDDDPQLAERYNVSSIPRLMIFLDGSKIADHVGMMSETELRGELMAAAARQGGGIP